MYDVSAMHVQQVLVPVPDITRNSHHNVLASQRVTALICDTCSVVAGTNGLAKCNEAHQMQYIFSVTVHTTANRGKCPSH